MGKYQDYDSTSFIGNFWLFDAFLKYAVGERFSEANTALHGLFAEVGGVNIFNTLPQFSNFESDLYGYDPTQGDIRGRFLYAKLGTKW